MSDLDQNGKGPVVENNIPPKPATTIDTTKKAVEPPVEQTQSGFNYNRGNLDTTIVTLLATINMNIVANTKILKKAIEEMKK